MKRRILSLMLALCLMLSLTVVPVSAASPAVYSAMSDSYKSGPYYKALMSVNLTGNQIADLINVARSQVGYHAGTSKTTLSGTSTSGSKYVEYFNLISPKTQGNAWCATFVTWCFREAGIPTSIMPSATGCGKVRNSVKNQGATYHSLESGYKPKKGDIILYESMGGNYSYYQVAKRDANGLPSSTSHVGIVSGDYNSSTNKFRTIQRKGAVVKEFDEAMNTWGWNKDKTVKIKRIQGFVTPAYTNTGSGSSKNGILTMYYNANGGQLETDVCSMTSDGMILKDGVKVTSVWKYGEGNPTYGLWDASSFGLWNPAYKIVGWSLSPDGSTEVFGQNDLSLKAEDIYPDLDQDDVSVTLYAVWEFDGIPVKPLTPAAPEDNTEPDEDEGEIEADMTGSPDDELTDTLTTDDVAALLEEDMASEEEPEESAPAPEPQPEPEPEEEPEEPAPAPAPQPEPEPEEEPEEPAPAPAPQPEPEPEEESTIIMQIDNPVMIVNGKVTPVDERGNTPVIRNSRTMLPVSSLILAMGGTVKWDGTTQTVTLEKNGKVLNLRIGTNFAWDDSGKIAANLDSPPIIINGRTMLPVAAIVLYYGAGISWDGSTRTVTITY